MKIKNLAVALLTSVAIIGCKKDKEEDKASGAESTVDVSKSFDKAQIKAIEQVVHDYLIENPEVIKLAAENLQRKAAENQLAKVSAIVKANQEALDDTKNSPVQGAAAPDITLVVFGDYMMSDSLETFKEVQSMMEQDKNIRVIFRFFPKTDVASQKSARVALSMHKQGLFDLFHAAMIKNTDPISSLMDVASTVPGVDMKRLEADMDSAELKTMIQDNQKLATNLGLKEAPGFVAGDLIIPGPLKMGQGSMVLHVLRERSKTAKK